MLQGLRFGAVMSLIAVGSAQAQEADQPAVVDVELNATASQEGGCLLSFVVQNGHAADISQAIYEAVLFDETGRVHQLTLFDFGLLPAARPRVRQFIVPDLACEDMSRIIFNGASLCTSETLGPEACTDGLVLRSRTGTELLG